MKILKGDVTWGNFSLATWAQELQYKWLQESSMKFNKIQWNEKLPQILQELTNPLGFLSLGFDF